MEVRERVDSRGIIKTKGEVGRRRERGVGGRRMDIPRKDMDMLVIVWAVGRGARGCRIPLRKGAGAKGCHSERVT